MNIYFSKEEIRVIFASLIERIKNYHHNFFSELTNIDKLQFIKNEAEVYRELIKYFQPEYTTLIKILAENEVELGYLHIRFCNDAEEFYKRLIQFRKD